MAGPLFKLWGSLGLDARQFDAGLSQREKMLKGFGGAVMGGIGLGAGLTTFSLIERGIGSVVDGFGDITDAASNMTETQSKLDVVFESSASTLRDWASDAADSMGLTQQAALENAGTLGNFLQAMGQAEAASASMSMDIVSLSADLASFNNIAGGAEEVLLALRSGLAGETEPMRRFGVDISDAAVQAKLLAQGIEKVNGAFTQTQKVQARFEIIMEKTSKAQGDFARTADNAANASRSFDAKIGDLQVSLGQLTLGPATAFLGFLNDVIDVLTGNAGANSAVSGLTSRIKALKGAVVDLPEPGDWLLSNTPIDSAVDGIFALQEGIEDLGGAPFAAKIDDWADGLRFLSTALGDTEDQLRTNAVMASQAGLTFDEVKSLYVQAWQDMANAADRADFQAAWRSIPKVIDPAADAMRRMGRVTDATDDALRGITDGVEIGKGAFKSFHDDIRADERRTRYFIRHPGRLEQEIGFIDKAMKRAEKDKQRILADGFQEGDALALEATERRIDKLLAMKGDYRALGTRWANAAEHGFEQAFHPTFDFSGWVQGFYGSGMTAGQRGNAPVVSGAKVSMNAGGGITVQINGPIYGGEAGLRRLAREIEQAVELGLRERDR